MDAEDKSVEVDFEWVKNLVSDGKVREHDLKAAERSATTKFLLLDVRRLVNTVNTVNMVNTANAVNAVNTYYRYFCITLKAAVHFMVKIATLSI